MVKLTDIVEDMIDSVDLEAAKPVLEMLENQHKGKTLPDTVIQDTVDYFLATVSNGSTENRINIVKIVGKAVKLYRQKHVEQS